MKKGLSTVAICILASILAGCVYDLKVTGNLEAQTGDKFPLETGELICGENKPNSMTFEMSEFKIGNGYVYHLKNSKFGEIRVTMHKIPGANKFIIVLGGPVTAEETKIAASDYQAYIALLEDMHLTLMKSDYVLDDEARASDVYLAYSPMFSGKNEVLEGSFENIMRFFAAAAPRFELLPSELAFSCRHK